MMTEISEIVKYHEAIRGGLFISGFTVASFLFSIKSVIIKTLKEDVFDQTEYINERCQDIAINQSKDGFYGSLSRFSKLIYWAIATSFISAICQFTIGFIGVPWSAYFCLSVAALSWIFLALAVFFVQNNWSKAIEFADNKRNKEQEENIKKLKS